MLDPQPGRNVLDDVRIPTLPSCVLRLREVLSRADCGLAEVADVIASDPPISAKVLRIANSARYGLPQKTLSIRTAATVLGMRTLTTIAVEAGVASVFEHLQDVAGFSLSEYWKHSVLTGVAASSLAKRTRRAESDLSAEDYYTCGLLHDIGKLVMYDSFGERYARTLADSATHDELIVNEQSAFMELNHADVGGLCATVWQLPAPIPDIIYHHHRPSACPPLEHIGWLIACADEIADLVASRPNEDAMTLAASLQSRVPGSTVLHTIEAIEATRGNLETLNSEVSV